MLSYCERGHRKQQGGAVSDCNGGADGLILWRSFLHVENKHHQLIIVLFDSRLSIIWWSCRFVLKLKSDQSLFWNKKWTCSPNITEQKQTGKLLKTKFKLTAVQTVQSVEEEDSPLEVWHRLTGMSQSSAPDGGSTGRTCPTSGVGLHHAFKSLNNNLWSKAAASLLFHLFYRCLWFSL